MVRSGWILLSLFALVWCTGAGAIPIQWTVASGGNGHWYDVVEGGFFWDEARADAENRGGYLATPTSLSEWNFIKSNYTTWLEPTASRQGWLGAYQTNPGGPNLSSWTWVTGEPWSFTAWSGGEPNGGSFENWIVTWFHEGSGWNDHYHDYAFKYYIEYDTNPIPEPSTSLLFTLGFIGMSSFNRRGRGC